MVVWNLRHLVCFFFVCSFWWDLSTINENITNDPPCPEYYAKTCLFVDGRSTIVFQRWTKFTLTLMLIVHQYLNLVNINTAYLPTWVNYKSWNGKYRVIILNISIFLYQKESLHKKGSSYWKVHQHTVGPEYRKLIERSLGKTSELELH